MDARTYLDTHGEDGAKALIAALEKIPDHKPCTVGYFKQFAYGYRRPSPELAENLVSASETVAREWGHTSILDFKSLLDSIKLHKLRKVGEQAAKEARDAGAEGERAA